MEYVDITPFAGEIYAAAVRKAKDALAAEDIAQETFLAAFQSIRRGKEPENVRAWLLRILDNKYCDWLRRKYHQPVVSFADYPWDIAGGNGLQEKADYEAEWEQVRQALGYLAKTHREVLVRFYIHQQPIDRIAKELNIPIGTVKSRLHTGRRQIKEGMEEMENYSKQSYEPDTLYISCSGCVGLSGEPFSLVRSDDKLTQSILLTAYEKPLTETEISKALGVPAAFIEPIVERLTDGELMARTEGGRVYTDFIIYMEKDREATVAQQHAIVASHFTAFWSKILEGLEELRKRDFYLRQDDHARKKLELHFCIHTLLWTCIPIRDENTGGVMPYDDYPYRKNGGRWFAMGNRYSISPKPQPLKYSINGEAGNCIRNFCGAKSLELRKYDTSLGGYPNNLFRNNYVQLLYEIYKGVSPEESAVGAYVLESVDTLVEQGILTNSNGIALDIPVLTTAENHAYRELASTCCTVLIPAVRKLLQPLYRQGYVCLPKNLSSVPAWMQYMFCDSQLPMAVIYQAIDKGEFLQNITYPLPAALLVFEE